MRHFTISPLLTTVCKCLRDGDTSCRFCLRGILIHSWMMQDSSCLTVLEPRCQIFHFKRRQMFSVGERSGLQADQSSTWTRLLWSHAIVMDSVCGLALSCWNIQGLPWKRHCLNGSRCCSKTSMYSSALMEPFQMSRFPFLHHLLFQPFVVSSLCTCYN